MRSIAFMYLFLIVALMTGCFDDSDDSSSLPADAPPITEDQSAAGIYPAIANNFVSENVDRPGQSRVDAIIASTGEARFMLFGSSSIPLLYTHLTGNVNVEADRFTAPLKTYSTDSDGNTQISLATLDGTVKTKDGIWGNYTWGQDFGRFVLNYVSLYEEPSMLCLLEGIWTFSQASSSGAVFTFTLSIDPDGTVFGSHTAGCVYNGTFGIIDTRYNVYRLSLDASLCGELDGSYEGLATLSETQPQRSLMFGTSNEEHSLSGIVFSSLQP